MKLRVIALAVALAMLACGAALGEDYSPSEANAENLGELLTELLLAYETPSEGDGEAIEAAVAAIESVDATDGAIARAIAEHWRRVYLEDYRLYLHDGGEVATALAETGFADSATHAIVVLGYELKDGEMTAELKGRCDAAAAAARYWPSAILVCSGGPTGENNPDGHTEAGLMKDYLASACGIDPERIHIDERAMTTLQNAENTFAIMRELGVGTMTIVTSAYHQRWGQAIYNAMAAIYRCEEGYGVDIVGNYCFDTEAPEMFRHDDRFAIRQLAALLELPDSVVQSMKKRL